MAVRDGILWLFEMAFVQAVKDRYRAQSMEEGQKNAATYYRASLGIRNCYANCLVFRPNACLLIELGTDTDNCLDPWPDFY